MKPSLASATVSAFVLLLAGCQSSPPQSQPSQPTPPPQNTACEASGAQFAVGQHATPRIVERARLASGSETARTIGPDQAVTMEFNANRLNLDVNEGNIVTNVRCG